MNGSYTTVGIDPSINSTGVCAMHLVGDTIETSYHCIGANCSGSKPTKVTLDFYSGHGIKFHDYAKNPDKPALYSEKEIVKTHNVMNSAYELEKLLETVCEKFGGIDRLVMEGVSYGSTSGASIVDLAGLNFIYRNTILERFSNLTIASPSEIKKFATGNGSVDKDIMIKVWSKCERIDVPEDCKAKIDDIADAYFMALYGMCQCCPDFEKSLEIPKVDIPKHQKKHETHDIPEEILENFKGIQ